MESIYRELSDAKQRVKQLEEALLNSSAALYWVMMDHSKIQPQVDDILKEAADILGRKDWGSRPWSWGGHYSVINLGDSMFYPK